MFAAFDTINDLKVGISSGNQALKRCAFIGTNPTGELITSGLLVTREEQQRALLTAYTDNRFCTMGLVAGGPKELPAYEAILDTCRLAGPLCEEGEERHPESRADHSEEVGEQRRARYFSGL